MAAASTLVTRVEAHRAGVVHPVKASRAPLARGDNGSDVRRAMAHGDSYVSKPLRVEQLLDVVERHCA